MAVTIIIAITSLAYQCTSASQEKFTVYVNQSFVGNSDGSYLFPYANISDAVNNTLTSLTTNIIIYIYTGNYNESLNITGRSNITFIASTKQNVIINSSSAETLNLSATTNVQLKNLTIKNSANLTTINASSANTLNILNCNIESIQTALNVSEAEVTINNSNLKTTSSTDDLVDATNAKSISISSSTFSGGKYSLLQSFTDIILEATTDSFNRPKVAQQKNNFNPVLMIDNSSFSLFSETAIFLKNLPKVSIANSSITTIPLSLNTENAGIVCDGCNYITIQKNQFSGNGITVTDKQNSIYLLKTNNAKILNNTISANSRSGVHLVDSGFDLTEKVDSLDLQTQEILTNDSVVVNGLVRMHFNQISTSKRGLFTQNSKLEIYETTFGNNEINGLQIENSSLNLDQSLIQNTSIGPGLQILNSVVAEHTGYFIGNNTRFINNSNQAIFVSGQGFLLTVKDSTFEGNGSYVVEAPVQSDVNLFQCSNLILVSGMGIHPNLTSSTNNKCNL